jgi:hypothetical protein
MGVGVHIFLQKGELDHELGTGFLVHKTIISAAKRAEFVSRRMSYIILRGHLLVVSYLCSERSCSNRR